MIYESITVLYWVVWDATHEARSWHRPCDFEYDTIWQLCQRLGWRGMRGQEEEEEKGAHEEEWEEERHEESGSNGCKRKPRNMQKDAMTSDTTRSIDDEWCLCCYFFLVGDSSSQKKKSAMQMIQQSQTLFWRWRWQDGSNLNHSWYRPSQELVEHFSSSAVGMLIASNDFRWSVCDVDLAEFACFQFPKQKVFEIL